MKPNLRVFVVVVFRSASQSPTNLLKSGSKNDGHETRALGTTQPLIMRVLYKERDREGTERELHIIYTFTRSTLHDD